MLFLTFSKCWLSSAPCLQMRRSSFQALLSAPNPDDPLNNEAAELWKTNEVQAIQTAQEWTKTHAQ